MLQLLTRCLLPILSSRHGTTRLLSMMSAPSVLPGGLIVREHSLSVPVDHGAGERGPHGSFSLFVREIVSAEKDTDPATKPMVFLQGGPGFPATRPTVPPSGWQKAALQHYRVFLLDQRGTGRSSPVTAQNLASLETPAAQAEFLTHFRQDSIVRDCEVVRERLCNGAKLTLLGQSFGGFCILTYCSLFPEAIERALFTCGLAPVGRTADEVYTATFKRMEERNKRYYRRYPQGARAASTSTASARMHPHAGVLAVGRQGGHGCCEPPCQTDRACPSGCTLADVELVRSLVARLHAAPAPLPRGGLLTARRLLQLGLLLGSGSGFESLHNLLELAIPPPELPGSTRRKRSASGDAVSGGAAPPLPAHFLLAVEAAQQDFETNPLYWILHEAIYCDGERGGASRWAAERVQASLGAAWDYTTRLTPGSEPVQLTGEMVYSWSKCRRARACSH